jgi:hypothetical protein
MATSVPSLQVTEVRGRVRLGFAGLGYGEGATLQEAADELVRRMLVASLTIHSTGVGPIRAECQPDPELLALLWELGELAASGGDIRERLFGAGTKAA